eukprot:Nk52_evm17s16 gene=Nk52_evmTU17s16
MKVVNLPSWVSIPNLLALIKPLKLIKRDPRLLQLTFCDYTKPLLAVFSLVVCLLCLYVDLNQPYVLLRCVRHEVDPEEVEGVLPGKMQLQWNENGEKEGWGAEGGEEAVARGADSGGWDVRVREWEEDKKEKNNNDKRKGRRRRSGPVSLPVRNEDIDCIVNRNFGSSLGFEQQKQSEIHIEGDEMGTEVNFEITDVDLYQQTSSEGGKKKTRWELWVHGKNENQKILVFWFNSKSKAMDYYGKIQAFLAVALKPSDQLESFTMRIDQSRWLEIMGGICGCICLILCWFPAYETVEFDASLGVVTLVWRNPVLFRRKHMLCPLEKVVRCDIADEAWMEYYLNGSRRQMRSFAIQLGVQLQEKYSVRLALGSLFPSCRYRELHECVCQIRKFLYESGFEENFSVNDVAIMTSNCDTNAGNRSNIGVVSTAGSVLQTTSWPEECQGKPSMNETTHASGGDEQKLTSQCPVSSTGGVDNSGMCCICLSKKARVVFFPCRHMSTCVRCSPELEECPICRASIAEKLPVYI